MKRSPLKRKTPLRKQSKRRQEESKEYNNRKSRFLDRHPICQWWCGDNGFLDNGNRTYTDIMLSLSGPIPLHEIIERFDPPLSCEIHHKCCGKNRKATYLREDTWMAVSAWGHDFIHKNPKLAYERGWLLKTIPEEPTNAI